MKNLIFTLLLIAVCIAACQNDEGSEISQKRKELEAKRKELKEKQELASLESEMKKLDSEIEKTENKAITETVSSNIRDIATRGRITGDQVILRNAASVQSAKVDNFAKNETVTILSRASANQGNEAIVTQNIQLFSYTSSGKTPVYTLPKGKAVILQEYVQQSDSYRITYQHPEMGKLEAEVRTHLLENISNQIWYQVRRANGQTGWVLGKFLAEI
jgi:uncharacterized protein YgiM (DUF1202 family)